MKSNCLFKNKSAKSKIMIENNIKIKIKKKNIS